MQKRKQRGIAALVVFLAFFSEKSASQSLSFSRNSRTFETQQSSLIVKGLGHACLGLADIPDSIPCNPANIGLMKNRSLGVNLMLSNGYKTLESAKKLLSGEISQSTIDLLFQENQILQIELNSEVNLRTKFFNVRLVPQTLKYFSIVRNEANPEIEVYTVSETSVAIQSGVEIYNHIFGGVQLRGITRKFIRKQVFLVDLATQQGKDSLKPNEENLLFLDPGITWAPEVFWSPKVSFLLANVSLGNAPSKDLPAPMESELGVSLSPPIGFGTLDFNFDIRSMNYEESFSEKIRFGTLYGFGGMHLFAGIDPNGISAGLYYKVEELHAGLVYSSTEFPERSNNSLTQTIYTQFGWQN